MTWEPTTRGTNPNKRICHNGLCREYSPTTAHYAVDGKGRRYFCKEHWTDVCALMRSVHLCVDCERNHLADYHEEDRFITSFKFQDKWWNLCGHHFVEYDDSMNDFVFGD